MPRKRWMIAWPWVFCAHPHPSEGPDAWHGFPVIGAEVDERVLAEFARAGVITSAERRKLRGQRTLPERWP